MRRTLSSVFTLATLSVAAASLGQVRTAPTKAVPDTRVPQHILGMDGIHRAPNTPEVAKYLNDRSAATAKWIKQSNTGVRAMATSERLLVVYDHWSAYSYIGELYARQMKDLLSGTGYGVDLVPLESYTSGMIGTHRATFYMGVFYDTALPTPFVNDVMNTAKPVCWTGYNLWKLAWMPDYTPNYTFENKFGIRYNTIDEGYSSVTYKSRKLGKFATEAMKMTVLDATKASVKATASNGTASIPYIIKSGNLWVVADNPIASVVYAYQPQGDRTLAFCDVVHDITNDGAVASKKALLRIEDVSADANPTTLRRIADFLYAEGVPFVVSTIPIYRDPLGYWNEGTPVEVRLKDAPNVVAALKYMETKGGQIIQHGTTHQYLDVPNPDDGVSGDDWEFFRLSKDTAGNYIGIGPVPEDSLEWVSDRIITGQAELAAAGFATPKGWLTPHYLASPLDYSYFATKFEYSLDRVSHFVQDNSGNLFWRDMYSPWPIKDEYGTIRLPETVNYLSDIDANLSPANLVNRARSMQVVRDGWVGMYFHPYLPVSLLKTAVKGVKNLGYTFVNASKDYAPVEK